VFSTYQHTKQYAVGPQETQPSDVNSEHAICCLCIHKHSVVGSCWRRPNRLLATCRVEVISGL